MLFPSLKEGTLIVDASHLYEVHQGAFEIFHPSEGWEQVSGLEALVLTTLDGANSIDSLQQVLNNSLPNLSGNNAIQAIVDRLKKFILLQPRRGQVAWPIPDRPSIEAVQNALLIGPRLRRFPSILYISPSDNCNLDCNYCCRKPHRNYEHLSKALIMRVIEEASVGEARNIVWGGGEPTLNPDLSSYIRNAHSLGLCSAMATNGVLLSDVLSKINPNMLTDIRLSIDTINPAIFSRMCSGSPEWLQRVMQNTKDAIQAGYNITVQTTVTPDNIGCLDELISFCSELGVPRIFLSPANMGYDIALSDNFLSKGQLRDLEFLVAESANNSNITSRVELMFTGSMKPQWCGGLFYSMAIHSNGYVSPCPVLGTPVVGNISVSSISDVWHGEKYCQLRRHASLKEFMPELCSECTSAESCKTGCYLIKHAASVDYRGPDPRCTNHHVPGIS